MNPLLAHYNRDERLIRVYLIETPDDNYYVLEYPTGLVAGHFVSHIEMKLGDWEELPAYKKQLPRKPNFYNLNEIKLLPKSLQ